MTSYRFCRTDDMSVLVDAYNRCWLPHFPEAHPFDVAGFKRRIRDIDLWCSSSMVAFAGAEPVAVLWGAKRPTETLVDKIATSPDHLRHGHARHLLTSLSSKLAILGPSRLVAEVPAERAEARALFEACGWVEEVTYVSYALVASGATPRSKSGACPHGTVAIPVTASDLAANGLLEEEPGDRCWERASPAILRQGEGLEGLALATDERIEAFVLFRPRPAGGGEIMALRSLDAASAEPYLAFLVGRILERTDPGPIRFEKVHPDEASPTWLHAAGFEAGPRHIRYSATAGAA